MFFRYNADVIKFAGDSVVAIFPIFPEPPVNLSNLTRSSKKSNPSKVSSPLSSPRHRKKGSKDYESTHGEQNTCDLAVKVALSLQEDQYVKNFVVNEKVHSKPSSRQNQSQGKLRLRVKFGIAIGDISLTHIGGASDKVMSRRVEYVAVGDALEEAFNCEGKCGPGQVVVSRRVWKTIKSKYLSLRPKLALGNRNPTPYRKTNLEKDHGTEYYLLAKHNDLELVPVNRVKPDFSALPDSVLWSYVPLTAKPYLRTGVKANEKWVNEFRKVSTVFCQLGFSKELLRGVVENDLESLKTFNKVFTDVQNCVFRFEGQINKFLIDDKGNTLIIVFGLSPFAHENDAARAVLCGEALIKTLKKNNLWRSVGISTGMVYCGLFGNLNRKEYTVLGDSVNVAARLMSQVIKDHLPTGMKENDLNASVDVNGSGHERLQRSMVQKAPMYIDLPTRVNLLTSQIPVQFMEREKPCKVKGKAEELRLFYPEMFGTTLARSVEAGKLLCACKATNAILHTKISRDAVFADVRRIFCNKKVEIVDILWEKNPGIEKTTGLPVHPEEKLMQLAVRS